MGNSYSFPQGLLEKCRFELDQYLDRTSLAPLIIGVSGGSDSLALLILSCDWAKSWGRRVIAVTIDHGLNPQSQAWSERVRNQALSLGADWEGLSWEGPKPATGLPAKARQARHRLLAKAAHKFGAKVILLGHTADDLVESRWMRIDSTKSLPLVRKWSPSPVWPEGHGLFLLRPLLEMHRSDLRLGLKELGLSWIEDPANEDLRFSRARARKICQLDYGDLTTATSNPDSDKDLHHQLAKLAKSVAFGLSGEAQMPCETLVKSDLHTSTHLLSALVLSVGGGDKPPRRDRLHRLLLALRQGKSGHHSLCGTTLWAQNETLVIFRDVKDPRIMRRFESCVFADFCIFDGRFMIARIGANSENGFEERRFSHLFGHMKQLSKTDLEKALHFPAHIRPSLPVILSEEGKAFLPKPFGLKNPEMIALTPVRFAAACGLLSDERALKAFDLELINHKRL